MPSHYFFFSYATTDTTGDPWLKRFYEELAQTVRKLAAIKADTPIEDIGFFAGESIRTGDDWPNALAEGLQQSRVLVCLLSPSYISSTFCGREFHIFHSRWSNHATQEGLPQQQLPVILPVRWIPVADENLPPILQDIQNKQDNYGPKYAENGLYQVRKLYRTEYQKFLWQFANRLVTVAKKYAVKRLENLPPLKSVPNAFEAPRVDSPAASARQASAGPTIAQFIFVAGAPGDFEAAKIKNAIDCYSSEGARHWRPFLPRVEDDIGLLAQQIATHERFQFDVLPLHSNLGPLLKEAKRKRSILVIIVDSWTLLLQKYREILRDFDLSELRESVILVLLNNDDPETKPKLTALESSVVKTFPVRASTKDNDRIRYPVRSREELVDELGAILHKVKLKIIHSSDTLRKPEGETIAKPEVSGPGGIGT